MERILECVPNFSEGRNKEVIEKIADCFRGVDNVVLLDYSSDVDHNRTVVTVAGEPEALIESVLNAIGVAQKLIDLTVQRGQHPRLGATDVVPFIPIKGVTTEEAVEVSKRVGREIWERYNIPVFLYEKSASHPDRENLANIRKGEFEGLFEKMKNPAWHADFGKDAPHPTAGAIVTGARMPLVAFNVNLDSANLNETSATAKKVRFLGGGFRFCKAMGVELTARGITQVSMNMTDYTKTPVYYAYEFIRAESRRYNASIVGSEIVGLVPFAALYDCASYHLNCNGIKNAEIDKMPKEEIVEVARQYLKIENFSLDQVLEILLDKKIK